MITNLLGRPFINEDVNFNDYAITGISGIEFTDGQEITWNSDDYTINIPTGLGPILQVGQETYTIVYNNTGSQIDNLTAVKPIGMATDGKPHIQLAIAETHVGFGRNVWVTTMDIPTGTTGIVTNTGIVRGVDTSDWSVGDNVYLSATVSGALTNVAPTFPYYTIRVGGVSVSSETAGQVIINVSISKEDTVVNFWNGIFRESFNFRVSSSGTTVTGTLTPTNGNTDMTMMFSDGFTMLDTSPGAEVLLTPGTDDNPQTNYVYVPQSTKVLTVSTSSWPTTEHLRVALLELRSAATVALTGALGNLNWNDHIEGPNNQGHLSHMCAAIRERIPATWRSGVEATCTIDTASTPNDVWISTTAGVVMQMHNHDFPVFNTETGSDINVVNSPTVPYDSISNLNTQLVDSQGNSLNNKSFSFVLWGIGNSANEPCHLMLNLPTDSYAFVSPDDAVQDAFNYSVYEIPHKFYGVGFLIARFTFTYKNDDWTLYDTEDLRGRIPNATVGGGGGGTGVTSFLGLTDTPSAYTGAGEYFVKVASGETALEFVESPIVESTPATSAATGIKGTVTWDTDYIYVCTATNTWKRTLIETW